MIEELWNYHQFFLKMKEMIQKFTNLYVIKFNISIFIIIIIYKNIKIMNIMKISILNYHIWYNIEFIINYLIISKLKNIHVDLIFKFIIININNEKNTDEKNLNDEIII